MKTLLKKIHWNVKINILYVAAITVLALFLCDKYMILHEEKIKYEELSQKYKVALYEEKIDSNIESEDVKDEIIKMYHTNPQYSNLIDKMIEFEYLDFLITMSESYDYNWTLFASIIYCESGFNSNAYNPSGAKGLMQLTKWVYTKDSDPFNEYQNIFLGITYFHNLSENFRNKRYSKRDLLQFTIASYNCGYGTVIKSQKIAYENGNNELKFTEVMNFLPEETVQYVTNVMKIYTDLSGTRI